MEDPAEEAVNRLYSAADEESVIRVQTWFSFHTLISDTLNLFI